MRKQFNFMRSREVHNPINETAVNESAEEAKIKAFLEGNDEPDESGEEVSKASKSRFKRAKEAGANKVRHYSVKAKEVVASDLVKVRDFASDPKGKAIELAKRAREITEGLGVDIDKASKNKEFQKFLENTHEKPLDWIDPKEHVRIKERFRTFERAKKVKESYTQLFSGKLKGLVENDAPVREAMWASILEMAENDPEGLRALEKQVRTVERSQKEINQKQQQIDAYQVKGGQKGLEDKLDTLTKANSWRRVLAQYSKKYRTGKGEDYWLAYQKSVKEFGVKDKDKFKSEIKITGRQLEQVKDLAGSKEKIREQHKEARQNVLLDNKVARGIDVFIQKQMVERMVAIEKDLTKLKLSELKEARTMATAFKELYEKEIGGDRPAELDDITQFEQNLETRIQELVERRIERLISETPADEISGKVEIWMKKKDFAGASQRESAKSVYNAFMKVKEKLSTQDKKYIELEAALSTFKYLAA